MPELCEEYCYLTVLSGPRTGTNFMLHARQANRIGRGTTCEIVVTDPNCSRVHASIARDENGWCLLDEQSRNGCFVNQVKVDKTYLKDGDELRLGEMQFRFHRTDEPPTQSATGLVSSEPAVFKEASVDPRDSSQHLLAALENAEFAHDLLVIYQLSVKLLEFDESDPVIRTSLDLLYERTKAAVVGFLWATDQGQLRPKMVLPDQDEDVSLNESLSQIVLMQGRAIWLSHYDSKDADAELRRYSDAICVPLVKNQRTLGVLHLYLRQGRFRRADFDFAISVANLMSVALVRIRREMSLKADHQRLANEAADFNELIGNSTVMQDLKSKIKRIAGANGAVLIRGESGSGKELVARALHAASSRRDRPLLSVNCAAIPADLIESQLFGHRRGAFTGAERDHDGWFQQADTGTLFLDEIGELPIEGQAKLLRILEGHPFLPVGAVDEVSVDVRLIAATNRDLRAQVRNKTFRQDLYFRLSVFEVDVPPLRDRGDDVAMLVDHFLKHYRKLHGRPQLHLSDNARERLLDYEWPGNVRQLRNVIDSAVVLAEGDLIERQDLGIQSIPLDHRPATLKISDWERMLITDALSRTRGKVPEAAKLLGIGRATLYRKIDEYDIRR